MDYQGQVPPPRGGRPVTAKDIAQANDYFEHFLNATSLKNILGCYRSLCDHLSLKPNLFPLFYPKLKGYLTSWRAKALWKKFDGRAGHKCYGKGKLCSASRVLIIGGGPCGLRTAIEAQLLGAKVVVVEKRDRFSRNNVLHLWPFVIEDLRALGAKKFFGKFCAGAIDHCSIRQLQCILLKVALLLGVEVHTEVSFVQLIEPDPNEKTGWKAEYKPPTHPVSQFEFDVVIGADGKRNTLQGFNRKEFRGKLAIAITANFINKRTEAEARVEEISGVAFIFNQKFFKDLHEATGIDLENIVYYKDDTHYFVMTAKKPSLIEKGVIKQDLADTERLLANENVDREALMEYAREAANFSTEYQMPNVEFAVNHYGQPDVAMFDFTSMYAAENASKVLERNGCRLLMILVGDSLLEPFWPTGSGCARGFLSSLDAGWAIRSWCSGTMTSLDVIAERESIYRLLGQTTPDNLNKDWKSYTLDPGTRYPNLNKNVVMPLQTTSLFDTDNPKSLDRLRRNSLDVVAEVPKKRKKGNVDNEVLLNWISDQVREYDDIKITDIASVFRDGKALCAILEHYRHDLIDFSAIKSEDPVKLNQLAIDLLEKEIGILPIMTGEEITNAEDYLTMAAYLAQVYDTFRCEIPHIKHPKLELPEPKTSDLSIKSFKHHMVQPSIPSLQPRPNSRHKRHADPISFKPFSVERRTRKRRTLEKMGATVDHDNKPPTHNRGNTDEDFAARIRNLEEKWKDPQPAERKPKDLMRAIGKIETSDWNIKEIEKKIRENKSAKPVNKDKEKVPKWSKEQFLARQTKMEKQHLDRQDSADAKFADIDKNIKDLDLKLKEGTARDLCQNKVATISERFGSKVAEVEPPKTEKIHSRPIVFPSQNGSEFCHFCGKRVYLMERLSAEGRFFHHGCFKCQYCHTQLRLGSYAFDRDGIYEHKFFCLHHYGMQGELKTTKVVRKVSQRNVGKSPEKRPLGGIKGVDLLDRVRTPERVEFANLSTLNTSDHEESLSQMDEDEWTDKNFGASTAELGSSDDESSSLSETDSDDEDAFEEALEEPATKEGTLKWAERFNRKYSRRRDDSESDDYSSSDQSSYYENTSDDDESDTATEGEEEIRARELRKQEVRVEPPVVQTDTGSDTEVVSDESTSDSSSEIRNSATEISTDSEFAHDDPTPTRESLPLSGFNDINVTKRRSNRAPAPRKIQVTAGYIQHPSNKPKAPSALFKREKELKHSYTPPSVPSALVRKTAPNLLPQQEGYALNRTQSTGGIAAKVSLELKKKWMEESSPSIQKSGSASTLDTKLKSFTTSITDCQKLLNCNKLDDQAISPVTPPVVAKPEPVFENEPEGRPRSPVHETSIIVPQIDWTKTNKISDDSLSTDSVSDENRCEFNFESIPTIRIDEIALDSLIAPSDTATVGEPPKSITSEKKSLNQPKVLPNLDTKILPEIHEVLHTRRRHSIEAAESDLDSIAEPTVALTETELSDWARDDLGDDDDDDDFELNYEISRSSKKPKTLDNNNIKAKISEVEEDLDQHVCGKENTKNNKTTISEALNSVLGKNLDIEFMDTGSETTSEDGVVDSQNGYVLFKDEDEMPEDSLNPAINDIIETKNDTVKNTGYCIIEPPLHNPNKFGSEVIDLNVADLERFKIKQNNDHDDDSLLIVDTTGTTTEENTCSDSTVKNLTEVKVDSSPLENNNFQRKRLEEKLAKLKAEQAQKHLKNDNLEFDEHCQRLQSKIEFSNAKDSIDVRKSRRRSKPDVTPQKPDLIAEENNSPLQITQTVRTPEFIYKKEYIEKERDINQKLVQEMVMNKMKAENKSLERKKRRGSRQFELAKSATTDIVSEINKNNNISDSKRLSNGSSVYATPDVLLSALKNSPEEQFTTPLTSVRPVSAYITTDSNKFQEALKGNPSLPDVRKVLLNDFETPIAPPRLKTEKMRQEARLRAQMLSNEQLGLSPEDKLRRLKERLTATPIKTKSIENVSGSIKAAEKFCKSDPNLLDTDEKKDKKKRTTKDRERRKSITKFITTLFTKKSPSGLFSKLSPKSKDVSKSCANLDLRDPDVVVEEPARSNSFSNLTARMENRSPPPVPPLPLNYSAKGTDDSSEGGEDWKRRSSCDTLDQSVSGVSNNRHSRGAKRIVRQAQLKRHRMAQEIQRKLEETEVKMRELEQRGVLVEKALRGEDDGRYSKEESDLLQEWFDLMRDRTELRRYEKELMVRGQELELEDRHARLQNELRERLKNSEQKTEEDVTVEGHIIDEMMDIVAKRDSLIALLEEDRLRYSNEDRDFEEQMLAKGLKLTPIRKTPDK